MTTENPLIVTEVTKAWDSGDGLSYAEIELIEDLSHISQLAFFRENIGDILSPDRISSIQLTKEDKHLVSAIPLDAIVLDDTTKTIVSIIIPEDYTVTLSDSTVLAIGVDYPVEDGESIRVTRDTISDDRFVEYQTGSKYGAQSLNYSVTQLLSLLQEIKYDLRYNVVRIQDAGTIDSPVWVQYLSNGLDMGGAKIINLGLGTDDDDAANMTNIAAAIAACNAYADGLIGTDPGTIPLTYDDGTNTIFIDGVASGQGNLLSIRNSSGIVSAAVDSNYRIGPAIKIFYDTSAPTGSAAPTNDTDSTAEGLLWYDSDNGSLKVWSDYGSPGTFSWQESIQGSFVTLTGSQTISGAKTFSANLLLSGTARILGSGTSKAIELRPTNSGGSTVSLFSLTSDGLTIADLTGTGSTQSIVLDDDGNITCKNITVTGTFSGSLSNIVNTTSDQSIAGVKTFTNANGIVAEGVAPAGTNLALGIASGGAISAGLLLSSGLILARDILQVGSTGSNKNLNVKGNIDFTGNLTKNGSAYGGITPGGIGSVNILSHDNSTVNIIGGTWDGSNSPSSAWTYTFSGAPSNVLGRLNPPTSGTWNIIRIMPNAVFSIVGTTQWTIKSSVFGSSDTEDWSSSPSLNFTMYENVTSSSNNRPVIFKYDTGNIIGTAYGRSIFIAIRVA